MNAKTSSHICVHSFTNDASNHHAPSDGPGALLDMLAEVASRTLRSESIRATDTVGEAEKETQCKSHRLLSMPPTQLVKRFSLFTGDELKRRYSYECNLVPGCRQKYTSFASDSRAKISITSHLVDHLDRLRNEREPSPRGDSRETATGGVETSSERVNKRGRSRRREDRDKENEMAVDSRKTDEERERERSGTVAAAAAAADKRKELEAKVLGDHSYYERIARPDEPVSRRDGWKERDDVPPSENIVLMVVEGERCRIEQFPTCRDTVEDPSVTAGSSKTNTEASLTTCKPKGKAKFIGTSKEEREMALLLMERIKKRGNPTGGNLQCRICVPPRSFTAPTTLVSHYRSHAGIKPYECRICRSVFTRRHSLKYHMLIHQNQTRFTCADCGKKFRHPSHFREHRRRHTGESPFACEDCGQRFKTRNTYKRHLKTRHGKVLTTSGELLCLTEDEFDKVQTNRKRSTRGRSVSEDYSAASEQRVGRADESLDEGAGDILYDGIVNEDGEEGLVEIELDGLTERVDGEYAGLELQYDRTLEMDDIVRGIVVESLSIGVDDDNGDDCCTNNNNNNNDNHSGHNDGDDDNESVFLDRNSHKMKLEGNDEEEEEEEEEGQEEQEQSPPRCVVVLANDEGFPVDYLVSDDVLVSSE